MEITPFEIGLGEIARMSLQTIYGTKGSQS